MAEFKVHREFKQHDEEWFAIKWGRIGASSVKSLLVGKALKESALFKKIRAQRSEDFWFDEENTGFSSASMDQGTEREPYALAEVEKAKGIKFVETAWIQSKYNILGLSPDGVTEDCTIAGEFKCLEMLAHSEIVNEALEFEDREEIYIPTDHVKQCIDYFAVIPQLKELHFCAYRPEHKYKPVYIATIKRDSMVSYNYTIKSGWKCVKVSDIVTEIHNKAIELENLVDETIKSLEF